VKPQLADVYDECVWSVYGFFAYRVRSREEAEDLTQLAFERAVKAWDRFDPQRAKPNTWLLAIAHNLLIDHYRRDRSAQELPIGPDGVAEESLQALDGPDQRGLGVAPELAAALEQLGAREREVIALRFGGDLNGPEIALLLGISLANVQQILSRALRRLRELLERIRERHPRASELSMGMSLDYEVAIEEGATMVRIGTALFGERPPR